MTRSPGHPSLGISSATPACVWTYVFRRIFSFLACLYLSFPFPFAPLSSFCPCFVGSFWAWAGVIGGAGLENTSASLTPTSLCFANLSIIFSLSLGCDGEQRMAGGLCQSEGCCHLFSRITLEGLRVSQKQAEPALLSVDLAGAGELVWIVGSGDTHEARRTTSSMHHFFPNR